MSQCNSFSTVLLSIALPWKYCSLNEYLSVICFPFWLGTIRVPMTRQSMFFPLAKLLIHVFTAQPGRWVMVSNQAAKSNRWAELHRKEDTEVIKLRRKGSHSHFILVKFCTIFKTVTEFSWLVIPMHCQRMVRRCCHYTVIYAQNEGRVSLERNSVFCGIISFWSLQPNPIKESDLTGEELVIHQRLLCLLW